MSNTFKITVKRNLANIWFSLVNNELTHNYKRKICLPNGKVYYGCYPIKLEQMSETSYNVILTISYDSSGKELPETIFVNEIF